MSKTLFDSGRVPRLLVVSGVPPGEKSVGEIILQDINDFYPDGHMSFFVVSKENRNSNIEDRIAAQVKHRVRRFENPSRLFRGRLGGIIAFLIMQTAFRRHVNHLVRDARNWAREQGSEMVLVVLNSATTIAMAPSLQRSLGLPMLSLVWDPPGISV